MKNTLQFLFFAALLTLLSAGCPDTGTVTPCPPCPNDSTVVVPPPPIGGPIGDAAKIGSCVFTWTPIVLMDTFSFVNCFISANFISTETGLFLDPIFRSRTDGSTGLDSWIKALNAKGCTPMLCLNGTPDWFWTGTPMASLFPKGAAMSMRSDTLETYDPHASFKAYISGAGAQRALTAENVPDHPPVKPGASRTDPKSYATYARIFGELAKRYGSVKHPESGLWINSTPRWTNDPPNARVSGLNYKFILVVWNEPEKFWKRGDGSGIYMEAAEYAALFKACYDAVKEADKSVPVFMAGMTGFEKKYVDEFLAALRALGGTVPDGFNFHHYQHLGNKLGIWPPTWFDGGACPPELDLDFTGIVPLVALAKQHNRPIYVTEFGTDTRPPSWMYPMAVPGRNAEQLQADWLVRTYLEYIRLGVDGMSMFNGNDEPGAANGGLYVSSGMLYGEGDPANKFKPKPAYHAVANLKAQLMGMKFVKDESTSAMRIMKFEGGGKALRVQWSPTAQGKAEETPQFLR